MVDLSNYGVDELKELKASVEDAIKARNKQRLEAERQAKSERKERFQGNVNTGDTIRFLYNREERVGTVKRANEKSVTVPFEDGKNHYIPYDRVVEIVERAPEEEDAEDEEEVAEAAE